MSNLVIQVNNGHIASCGLPPAVIVEVGSALYYGYFMNEHGEQWVFEYNRETRVAVLRGGDLGWDRVVTLKGPGDFGDVALCSSERAWLNACWGAVEQ